MVVQEARDTDIFLRVNQLARKVLLLKDFGRNFDFLQNELRKMGDHHPRIFVPLPVLPPHVSLCLQSDLWFEPRGLMPNSRTTCPLSVFFKDNGAEGIIKTGSKDPVYFGFMSAFFLLISQFT